MKNLSVGAFFYGLGLVSKKKLEKKPVLASVSLFLMHHSLYNKENKKYRE